MRITDSMRYRQALSDMNLINRENQELLLQAGTGRKLNRPSDSPRDAVLQLRLRQDIASQKSMIEQIETVGDTIGRAELAIDDGIQVFQRAQELVLEAGRTVRADIDFEAIATEADQLLNDMLGIANRQVNGRFLFAGTKTTTQPFTTTGDPVATVTYNGNTESRELVPAPGLHIKTQMPGQEAFVDGGIFQSLINLRDAASAGDVTALTNTVMTDLETAFDHLLDIRTKVGAITSSLDRSVSTLEDDILRREGDLVDVEDADLIEVLVRLKSNEVQRQAALQATARAVQPTLLDFLA